MPSLCCGVIRFLQDLPGPIIPSVLQADMIRAVQGEMAGFCCAGLRPSVRLVEPPCPLLLGHRGPRPGGLCSGVEVRGQLLQLPRPVRPDPAQRGSPPGSHLPARIQEPAESTKPGRELQPGVVQAQFRVSHACMLVDGCRFSSSPE